MTLIITFLAEIKEAFTNIGTLLKTLFFKVFPMKHQRQYLKSLLIHKWYVFRAGIELGVPIWQLIIHDWSKFLPDEFNPYADFFFKNNDGMTLEETKNLRNEHPELTDPTIRFAFLQAWLFHQRRNPHHWQFWYLIQDQDGNMALEMPYKYAVEMVADWCGAGRGYTGKWSVKEWYSANKDKIQLHEDTRFIVEELIESFHLSD